MKLIKPIMDFGGAIAEKIKISVKNKSDRKDGKLASPETMKFVITKVFPIMLVTSLALTHVLSNKVSDASSKLEEESKPKFGLSEGLYSGTDSDSKFGVKETLSEIENAQKYSAGRSASVSTGGSNSAKPNKFECREILAKVSRGESLDSESSEKLKICTDNNIGAWTPEQLEAAKRSNDQSLSPEARKALASYANNPNPDPNDPMTKIAQGLISSDPDKKAAAEQALTKYDSLSKDQLNKLADAASGKTTGKEATDLISKAMNLPAYVAGGIAGLDQSKLNSDSAKDNSSQNNSVNPYSYSGSGDSNKTPSQLMGEISDLNAVIEALKGRLSSSESKIKEQASKGDYSALEQETKKSTETRKELDKKINELESKKIVFNRMYKNYKVETMKAKEIARGNSGSIATIKVEDDIPEFIPTKKKAQELTPDELRILDLLRQSSDSRKSINMDNYAEVKLEGDASALVVSGAKKDRAISLHPSVKVLSVLETQILVTKDSASGFPIQARALMDVNDYVTGEKVIYKNAIVSGRLNGFDAETESATLSFNKITVGPETFDVNLTVQVKGKVKDTKGKIITAALLTDFVGAVTDKIAKDAEENLSSVPDLLEVTNTAGVSATASGIQKVAQILAADLAGAKQIFYLPKNIPLVLRQN